MLQPLIDRIEIIHVPAYLPIEKFGIAKEYLIPTLEAEYGFKNVNENVRITDAAIRSMIINYCGHEAGVRNLKKCLDRIFRKIVAKLEEK
jgi:Lon-like ATP-dependent protease